MLAETGQNGQLKKLNQILNFVASDGFTSLKNHAFRWLKTTQNVHRKKLYRLKFDLFAPPLIISNLQSQIGLSYGDCIKISVSSNHIEFLNTDETEHQEEILRLWEKRRKRLTK